jgi:ABC-type glycerol-3-phosphate transport system substrate-binding protein
MRRAALLATAVVLALAACGGDDDSGAAPSEPAAGAETTAGSDTTAASGGMPGEPGAAPTEVPDPCTLLTEDEAFALLTTLTKEEYEAQVPGGSDLTPTLVENGLAGEPTCEYGNASVALAVSLIPATADSLDSYHQALLDNWTGDPLDGVGDGAELGGSTPVGLQAFDGYWQLELRAYVAALGPDEGHPDRFATAANLVFERLAAG